MDELIVRSLCDATNSDLAPDQLRLNGHQAICVIEDQHTEQEFTRSTIEAITVYRCLYRRGSNWRWIWTN